MLEDFINAIRSKNKQSIISKNWKNWIAQIGDIKLCEDCRKMHGKVFPISQFVLPLHLYCRCVIVPIQAVTSGYATTEGTEGASFVGGNMEREVRKFELDFSECTTWGEIYAVIRNKLELPDWCGENLDALWDALTGMMYTPAEITVSKNIANEGLASVVEQILAVMHEAENTYHKIVVKEKE